MAESSPEKSQDNLQDSSSSEEWTIIDQKDSQVDGTRSDEEGETRTLSTPQETDSTRDACQTEEGKPRAEHVQEGEEAGEKDAESDDVSILSDESESEQLVVQEGRIEEIEWQLEEGQVNEILASNSSLGGGSPHALISSTCCLSCSLIVVTLALVIAGRVAHLQGDVANYAASLDVAVKLKELAAIEDKLKELSNVKQALDQIRSSMPEMKKLKDQPVYQGSEEKYKNLDKQDIFNGNIQNDGLEMLEASYTRSCLIMNQVNSSNPQENFLCRTPRVLSDMITFKKKMAHAFKNTEKKAMPEKRMFLDAGRRLDLISESLLSELSTMFTRFSFKMQDRLFKFRFKLDQRLCLLNDLEKSDDKFLNILLDDDFFINNCNATGDPADYQSSTSHSRRQVKKNPVNARKADEKMNKAFDKDAKQDYTSELDDDARLGSKGEVENDNWKRDVYEREEYYGENLDDKNEELDYKYKREPRSGLDESLEGEEKSREHDKKIDTKNKKRDYNQEYKYKKDRRASHDLEGKKKHNDFKVHKNMEYRDLDVKFEGGKPKNRHVPARHDDFEEKINKRKIERRHDDANHDSKFIIEMDNGSQDETRYQERRKHKNKEYILKPENFKESKYAKYDNHERIRERKDKYPTGEWQMQRGRAREKQRNSDWYLVRADSRQKARSSDEEEEEAATVWRPTPPPPSRKSRGDGDSHSRDKPDGFKKRVMSQVGRTWDLLKEEMRNYL